MKKTKTRVENMNNKTLRDFVAGDTIYISKIIDGYQYIYFCEFVKLKRGTVIAKILEVDREWSAYEVGEVIHSVANKCFLWGVDSRMGTRSHPWERCYWFKGLDSRAE